MAAGKLARESTFAEDEDAITQREEFGKFAGGDEDSDSFAAKVVDDFINFGFGADVDTTCRVVE